MTESNSIDALYCSTCPIVCSQHPVVVSSTIRRSTKMARKEFDVKCSTVYVNTVDGISKFDIYWSTNIAAIAVAVVRVVGIALGSSNYFFVNPTMNWFPDFAFHKGPGRHMVTYSKVLKCEKSRDLLCLLLFWRFLAQNNILWLFHVRRLTCVANRVYRK